MAATALTGISLTASPSTTFPEFNRAAVADLFRGPSFDPYAKPTSDYLRIQVVARNSLPRAWALKLMEANPHALLRDDVSPESAATGGEKARLPATGSHKTAPETQPFQDFVLPILSDVVYNPRHYEASPEPPPSSLSEGAKDGDEEDGDNGSSAEGREYKVHYLYRTPKTQKVHPKFHAPRMQGPRMAAYAYKISPEKMMAALSRVPPVKAPKSTKVFFPVPMSAYKEAELLKIEGKLYRPPFDNSERLISMQFPYTLARKLVLNTLREVLESKERAKTVGKDAKLHLEDIVDIFKKLKTRRLYISALFPEYATSFRTELAKATTQTLVLYQHRAKAREGLNDILDDAAASDYSALKKLEVKKGKAAREEKLTQLNLSENEYYSRWMHYLAYTDRGKEMRKVREAQKAGRALDDGEKEGAKSHVSLIKSILSPFDPKNIKECLKLKCTPKLRRVFMNAIKRCGWVKQLSQPLNREALMDAYIHRLDETYSGIGRKASSAYLIKAGKSASLLNGGITVATGGGEKGQAKQGQVQDRIDGSWREGARARSRVVGLMGAEDFTFAALAKATKNFTDFSKSTEWWASTCGKAAKAGLGDWYCKKIRNQYVAALILARHHNLRRMFIENKWDNLFWLPVDGKQAPWATSYAQYHEAAVQMGTKDCTALLAELFEKALPRYYSWTPEGTQLKTFDPQNYTPTTASLLCWKDSQDKTE